MIHAPAKRASKTGAVVPAFNEAGNIGGLVEEIGRLRDPPEVVVVDDGSTDATAAVAAAAGAAVLRLPFNCGIGGAVQAGVRFAVGQGYQHIVRLDGDGQHDPGALQDLLEPVRTGRADFVIGSRYLTSKGYQSTATRRMGTRWFSLLLRLACNLRVSDPTSGFWAANGRAAELLADEYASDYPEVDSVVHLRRHGCVIDEVPVVMRPRPAGGSSIDAPSALYYMLKVTLALAVVRLRPMA